MKKYNEFINEKTQLEMGIEVEKEHEDIYDFLHKYLRDNNLEMPITKEDFFTRIAKDHLEEITDYYTRLLRMEDEAKN